MTIVLAILGWFAANPLKTAMGVALAALLALSGYLFVSQNYYKSQNENLTVQLDTQKRLVADWQQRFGQLQVATNECNAKVTELQEKDKVLEQQIADANTKITDYENELQEDAEKIAAEVVPADCTQALQVLVNNTKTNVGKLKIKRDIK